MEHLVTELEGGQRLRSILRGAMSVSYSAMKSAKWDNRILRNGVPCPVDQLVHPGDVVTFLPERREKCCDLRPYHLPLFIPYQDDAMFVIDKPAPLACQSSLKHPGDSLENALFAYLGCPDDFLYRPVNRLDRGTSGLMVVARDAHSQYRLQELLHTEQFQRIYLAVLEGVPPQPCGTVHAPIAKEEAASVRRVIDPSGKPATTHYEVLRICGNRSLVRLQLETGRTHQIRVHMRYLGCPVFGDFLYGTESPLLPGRFALHSAEIHLVHPLTGQPVHVISPLPAELKCLMDETE